MKIIHVINYFQPKLGYQETFLAREQMKAGHDVSVITSDRYYAFPHFKKIYGDLLGDRKRLAGFFVEEGIPTYRLSTPFEVRFRVWLDGLENLVIKLKPDLVISHAILSSSFRLAKMKSGGQGFKLIVDDHMDVFTRKDLIGRLYYSWRKKRIQKMLVPWVDKFVGVSKETCNALETLNGVPKEKIAYIPLGSDNDLYEFNKNKRRIVREKFRIADNGILLLYSGKFNSGKGVDTLVRAFGFLETDHKVDLLLVGDGVPEFKNYLRGLLSDEKKIALHFHPFVRAQDLPDFYSASDICVWAKETSTSILDAASCSRPVIGCDLAAVKERLSNNNGLTYKTGDYEDLAAKIKYLCENDKLRQEMGDRGRELINEEFSWKVLSKKFIDCVNRVE